MEAVKQNGGAVLRRAEGRPGDRDGGRQAMWVRAARLGRAEGRPGDRDGGRQAERVRAALRLGQAAGRPGDRSGCQAALVGAGIRLNELKDDREIVIEAVKLSGNALSTPRPSCRATGRS